MTQEYVTEIADFISRYLSFMLGAGVHTSRVIRNSKRIGEALGVDVHIYTSQKTAALTVAEPGGTNMDTRVIEIPAYPISFEWNADLSALSIQAEDESGVRPAYGESCQRCILPSFRRRPLGHVGHIHVDSHRILHKAASCKEEGQQLHSFRGIGFCRLSMRLVLAVSRT